MARNVAEEEGNSRPGEAMAGLAKGLRVLESFGGSRPRMTISEAARHAGLSPASARRCLLTLCDSGYLFHDGKYFLPTPRLARLGRVFAEASPWVMHAQAYLDSARDVLDESVSLAVVDEGQCLFIARAVASQIVAMSVVVGARIPAHASATGRALLSGLPDDEVAEFFRRFPPTRLTPTTVTDIGELVEIVRQAREQGYAVSSEELQPGMHSLAVPVIDSRGTYVAAVSASAFTGRYELEAFVNVAVPVLTRVARDIGKAL
jgi:IclR family pca regulon transcriptional regulator